jgi:hypothetical protein
VSEAAQRRLTPWQILLTPAPPTEGGRHGWMRHITVTEKEKSMALAIQGSIWLGAGVTLVMLLSRRRKRRTID